MLTKEKFSIYNWIYSDSFDVPAYVSVAPASFFKGTPDYFGRPNITVKRGADERRFLLQLKEFYTPIFYDPYTGEELIYIEWIRKYWEAFLSMPINPETGELTRRFNIFDIGMDKKIVKEWIEETFDVEIIDDKVYEKKEEDEDD